MGTALGLIYPVRVSLDASDIMIDLMRVAIAPGMAVNAEIIKESGGQALCIATRQEEKDRAMSAPPALMMAVSSMMFIGSVTSLLLSVIFFMRAFTLVQIKLPGIFKEGFWVSGLLDKYIWDEAIPAEGRRNYLAFLGAVVTSLGLMAGFAFLQGILVLALWCSGIFIFGAILTLRRWFHYRHRL